MLFFWVLFLFQVPENLVFSLKFLSLKQNKTKQKPAWEYQTVFQLGFLLKLKVSVIDNTRDMLLDEASWQVLSFFFG